MVSDVVHVKGEILAETSFRLVPQTKISCDKGPYAQLFDALQTMIQNDRESHPWVINGKLYRMLICWSRDHVYTLKAAKYFMEDVKSGLDYWLETQTKSGMFWDCIYRNTEDPAPTWMGEALGEGWFKYDDGMKYIVRRVPVADHVVRYALRLARSTRPNRPESPQWIRDYVTWGAGPRASQYLVVAAKARAVLQGRFAATVEDVRALALPVLRHRVLPNFAAESEGITSSRIVQQLLDLLEIALIDGLLQGRQAGRDQ